MPQRTRRFTSPNVQGDDSFVEFRRLTRGEVKALDVGETWSALILRYLIGWNWIDFDYQLLRVPAGVDDFDHLTQDEIGFLIECAQALVGLATGTSDEAKDELKN
jgi:hypothetical protein